MAYEIYIRDTTTGLQIGDHFGIWIVDDNGNTARIDGVSSDFFINYYDTDIYGQTTNAFDQSTIDTLNQGYLAAHILYQAGPPTAAQIDSYNLTKLDLSSEEAQSAAIVILNTFNALGTTIDIVDENENPFFVYDTGNETPLTPLQTGQIVYTEIDYNFLSPNSNAIANTLLTAAGLDLNELGLNYSTNVGHNYLIDGTGDDILQGFSVDEDTVIYSIQGGDDTFYGGDDDNDVRHDVTDGVDTVWYADAAGTGTLEVYDDSRVMLDESGAGGFTDTLYSIEKVRFENFDSENVLDYSNFSSWVKIDSFSLLSRLLEPGTTPDTAVLVNEGAEGIFEAINFGTFITTDYDDWVRMRGWGVTEPVTVSTGAGEDIVDITVQDSLIDLGFGADTVKNAGSGSIIYTGAGDNAQDTLRLGDNIYYADAGFEDRIKVFGLFTLNGAGNDTLQGGLDDDYMDGGIGDDILTDTFGSNVFHGGAGNDIINAASSGNNVLYGEDGDDALTGGTGDDTAFGGFGNDIITGGDGNDSLDGDDGLDAIDGGAGHDTIDGGSGNDVIDGDTGNDEVYGGAGDDTITGGDGSDFIYGGDGEDEILSGAGIDTVYGGNGNDGIVAGTGSDFIYGGLGDDVYFYTLGDGDDTIQDDGGIDAIAFTAGILIGDLSFWRSGFDLGILGANLITVKGHFRPDGLKSVETLYFSDTSTFDLSGLSLPDNNTVPIAKNDLFFSSEDVAMQGNLLAANAGGQADTDSDGDTLSVVADTFTTVNGGSVYILANSNFSYTPAENYNGFDLFEYSITDGKGGMDSGTVIISVGATNDAPIAKDDQVVSSASTIHSGNVFANNGNGADFDIDGGSLIAVAGTYTSAEGASVTINGNGDFIYYAVRGFIGADSFSYTVQDGDGGSDTGTVTLDLMDAYPVITGTISTQTLNGTSSADLIFGLGGEDTIYGNDGNDIIYAHDISSVGDSSARDYLYGGNGNDILYAGYNDDYLRGDAGSDRLVGNAGSDLLYDGWGSANDIDLLEGAAGNDFYKARIETSSGQNNLIVINDSSGSDTLSFGPSVGDSVAFSAAQTVYMRIANDLKIVVNNGSQQAQVLIRDQFLALSDNSGVGVEYIRMRNASGQVINSNLKGIVASANLAITSTADNDVIDGLSASEIFSGGDGNDTLNGHAGNDTISGDAGNDAIYGESGTDTLNGGDGDDIIEGGDNNDQINGGNGEDTVVFSGLFSSYTIATFGTYITVQDNAGSGGIDTVQNNVERLRFLNGTYQNGVFTASSSSASYAVTDYASVEENNSKNINVLVNDQGTGLDVKAVGIAAHGTVLINANNTVTYTPNTNYVGNDSFAYIVQNQYGELSSAIVNISVYEPNLPFTLANNGAVVNEDQTSTITTAMLNAIDPDTSPENIVFTIGNIPAYGDLKLNGTNLATTHTFTLQDVIGANLTYLPDSNYFGSDSFVFSVYDGLNNQTNKTFSITVTDVLEPLTGTSAGETLNGSSSGDLIKGLAGNDTIYGNDGNDTMYAHDISLTGDTSGSDVLYGGNGNDTLYAGNGYDYLYGQAGNDVLYGTINADGLYDSWGNVGDINRMEGGGGNDTYKYTIEAATGQANLLYIYDSGGTGDGLSFGPASGISLNFSIGDLTFKRIGNDDIRIDGYRSGLGTFHVIIEDQLIDLSSAQGGIGIEQLRLSAAWFNFKNYLSGYSGSMQTEGTAGDDTIHGILIGNTNDVIYSGTGNDILYGDAGADVIYGEDGNDIIDGGNGIDTLYGGIGADIFSFRSATAFTGQDVVSDLNTAQGDRLDIADILYGYYTYGVNDITQFVQITDNGTGGSVLKIDQNGGGDSFVAVATILGVTGLTNELALETSGVLITH